MAVAEGIIKGIVDGVDEVVSIIHRMLKLGRFMPEEEREEHVLTLNKRVPGLQKVMLPETLAKYGDVLSAAQRLYIARKRKELTAALAAVKGRPIIRCLPYRP